MYYNIIQYTFRIICRDNLRPTTDDMMGQMGWLIMKEQKQTGTDREGVTTRRTD